MNGERIYLDHASTSPLRPEARAAMERCWDTGAANPASVHAEGRAAAGIVAAAREEVAALVGAHADEVFFTSGATEASNIAIRGGARAREARGRRVVSTRIEHAATRRSCEALAADGWHVRLLSPDESGRVDLADLETACTPETTVVTVIAGHNELGTIQALDEMACLARHAGALLHLDAVQAAPSIDLSSIRWDMLSLSAHKLGGPQGVGALVARAGLALRPIVVGGGQEDGLRPGTVPTALIAGFGAAARTVLDGRSSEVPRMAALRDALRHAIESRCSGIRVLGALADDATAALPHILTLAMDGLRSDELVAALDDAGIAASASAACAGAGRSHVLEAIRLPASVGVMRLSLGWSTTASQVDDAGLRVAETVLRLRHMGTFDRRRASFAARAAGACLMLSDRHWIAAETVFAFYEKEGVLPGARHLTRSLGSDANLERLFPHGLMTVASWLGLPIPQGGCRPGGL